MRPILLIPGDEISRIDSTHIYVFVKRIPADSSPSGRPKNIFRCDAFRGLDGATDEGLVEMSDYEVSRRCRLRS